MCERSLTLAALKYTEVLEVQKMRKLNSYEMLKVNGGLSDAEFLFFLPPIILGGGILGGAAGAYLGYSLAESYTQDSDPWIQYMIIDGWMELGASVGFCAGAASSVVLTAFILL